MWANTLVWSSKRKLPLVQIDSEFKLKSTKTRNVFLRPNTQKNACRRNNNFGGAFQTQGQINMKVDVLE